jgi:perosamine synthetase
LENFQLKVDYENGLSAVAHPMRANAQAGKDHPFIDRHRQSFEMVSMDILTAPSSSSATTQYECSDREEMSDRIFVAQPSLNGNELKYVSECVESTWISSSGPFIERFEKAFAEFCDARHAVVTNNGTTALHLALVALGIGAGDEVIIPALTYVASANAVKYCGATPVFADSDPVTMTIDPTDAATKITTRTKAIMPVHLYGHPADMERINALAARYGIAVVEDAAEAHGALCNGRKVGALGDCGVFSFFGNKIITTGEGGAVVTNDERLADRLRLYRGQGMDPARRYWFPVVGYNYRMTNVAAAIGVAQMERADDHLAARGRVADWYHERLHAHRDVFDLPETAAWATHVYWMYTVILRDSVSLQRDEVMARMAAAGIETRPVFYPMHQLPPYREENGHYPIAERLAGRGINLPTHAGLTERDIDRVVSQLVNSVRARG